MANLTSGFKTAAIASLPLDGIHTIVDVGGADGTGLAAILAAYPHMRGVLFDLPHVITSTPETLARHGVDDRDCWRGGSSAAAPLLVGQFGLGRRRGGQASGGGRGRGSRAGTR